MARWVLQSLWECGAVTAHTDQLQHTPAHFAGKRKKKSAISILITVVHDTLRVLEEQQSFKSLQFSDAKIQAMCLEIRWFHKGMSPCLSS